MPVITPVHPGQATILPKGLVEEDSKPKEPKEKVSGYSLPEVPTSRLRRGSNFGINISKALLVATAVAYPTIYKVPGTQKVINAAYRSVDAQPKPDLVVKEDTYIDQMRVDKFVAGYKGADVALSEVTTLLKSQRTGAKKFDRNNNNWLFDSSIEIKDLITELKKADLVKYRDEIELFEEINTASQLLFGVNGPNPYSTIQGSRPICDIIAAIQSQWLTPETAQNAKGRIRVTALNTSKDKFKIDVVVTLGDREFLVPFEALESYMSLSGNNAPTNTHDGSLATPIFSYALQPEIEKYAKVTPLIPAKYASAPLTLMTGTDNCAVFINSLSDEELIHVLSQAPHTPVVLTTYPHLHPKAANMNNPLASLKDHVVGNFQNLVNLSSEGDAESGPTTSPNGESRDKIFRSKVFRERNLRLLDMIRLGETEYIDPALSRSVKNVTSRPKSGISQLMEFHAYPVKEFKKVDGQYVTTLIDSNDKEFDLTLDQVRKFVKKATTEAKNVPNVGRQSIESLLLSLAFIVTVLYLAHKLNIVIDPNYKSHLTATGKWIVKELKRLNPNSNELKRNTSSLSQ